MKIAFNRAQHRVFHPNSEKEREQRETLSFLNS